MSMTPSTARPKRARGSSTEGERGSGPARRAASIRTPTVTAEQRHAMIAETAYRRAEQRGFTGGDPLADWLQSEREVDALLSRAAN